MAKLLTIQNERLCNELYELLLDENHQGIAAIIAQHPHMQEAILDMCANMYPHTIHRLMVQQMQPDAPTLDLELAEDMTWEVGVAYDECVACTKAS